MASKGHKTIIACLKDENILVFSKIRVEYLKPEEIKGRDWVQKEFDRSGKLPKARAYCEKFGCKVSEAPASAASYFEELSEAYGDMQLNLKVNGLLRSLKTVGYDKTYEEFGKLLKDVEKPDFTVDQVLFDSCCGELKETYKLNREAVGIGYLSMGNSDLDKVFHGYGKNDLITLGGRAGLGKSWLLCYLALQLDIVLRKQPTNKNGEEYGDILFITNEMNTEEVMERMACIGSEVSYPEFLSGKLSAEDKLKLFDYLDMIEENKSKIRFVEHCNTLVSLQSLLARYRPSAVFIDGSYLLETRMQEGWEKITFITRNLKLLAKQFDAPIINTTQLKRGAGKTNKNSFESQDDFAYSNSFVQDSDIALRMFQSPDMIYNKMIGLDIAKARRSDKNVVFSFQCDIALANYAIVIDETATEERGGAGEITREPHKTMSVSEFLKS